MASNYPTNIYNNPQNQFQNSHQPFQSLQNNYQNHYNMQQSQNSIKNPSQSINFQQKSQIESQNPKSLKKPQGFTQLHKKTSKMTQKYDQENVLCGFCHKEFLSGEKLSLHKLHCYIPPSSLCSTPKKLPKQQTPHVYGKQGRQNYFDEGFFQKQNLKDHLSEETIIESTNSNSSNSHENLVHTASSNDNSSIQLKNSASDIISSNHQDLDIFSQTVICLNDYWKEGNSEGEENKFWDKSKDTNKVLYKGNQQQLTRISVFSSKQQQAQVNNNRITKKIKKVIILQKQQKQ